MKQTLLAIMTVLACGFASAQSSAIEGNWGAIQQAEGFTFDMTFSIGKNSMTLTNVCHGFGTSAVAQVTVGSVYTDRTLTTLESKQNENTNGPLTCDVSVPAATMNYSVQGDQLILTQDGSPDAFILKRK